MTKRIIYAVSFIILITLAYSCIHHENQDKFTYHKVVPAQFPGLNIPGFSFPQDSVTLNEWIHTEADDKIHLHGWGIWTGLTSQTDQFIAGDEDPLLVFETWMTPGEIVDSINAVPVLRSNRANLNRPHQLTHFAAEPNSVNVSIHESVCYSPAAATFAIENQIFKATSLLKMAKDGMTEIPFFPTDAITIKPVFKVLNTSGGQTQFEIATWNGTIATLDSFPESNWNSYVTVDVTNTAKPGNNTFNLDDFIHYKLNAEDVHYFNKEFTENERDTTNLFKTKPGDIAILVGMHVGTREITNWTWQTFWWEKSPDNPPLPSSKAIADMRPDALQGAARHYAMAVAYYMVDPNEPYNGTDVTGAPNYAFNPYLEAGFAPSTFDESISFIKTQPGDTIETYVGVRTNCMSCHRMASINPAAPKVIGNPAKNSNTPYVGNSFVGTNDTIFKDQLKLDFAWSIQGNIDTLGLGAYLKTLNK